MTKTSATVQLYDSENLLPQETTKNGAKIVAKGDEVESEDSSENTYYRCDQLSYGIGDAVFATFLVAPLVVGVWRSTWGIMEIHRDMFPYAQIYVLGIIIHISFALLRSYLLSRSTATSSGCNGKFLWFRERVLSRVYTYIFVLSCIMHWRGGWGLFDAFVTIIVPKESDPHRAVLIATMTAVFYVSIAILRSARNILAPPYFVVTDGKEATYQFSTRFRKRFERCGGSGSTIGEYPLSVQTGESLSAAFISAEREFWGRICRVAALWRYRCVALLLRCRVAASGCHVGAVSPGCGARDNAIRVSKVGPRTESHRTLVAEMRGSTAGLAETLAGGSRAHAALLAVADSLFASLVVAPAVVAYWKSTWSLMDLYVMPDNPVNSAAACAIFGLCCDLFVCVFQSKLGKFLRPDQGRLTYYVLSRVYTYVAGVACVGAWRGVWNLLNECTGDSARTLLSTTGAATLSLAALRALRNISAAPFAIAVDGPRDYFDVPTMFRTSSREMALYVLDCIFSVTIVGSLVVFVWRGSWALLDIFLYPDDQVKSFWTSLGGGYIIVLVTFSLQVPMRWAVARLHGAPRLLLVDLYHLGSFLATVNVWRGVWGLLDVYYFPEQPKLSNWSTHVISFTLLILLNCSNTIIVRGVYIDAEEPAGDCVIFPCHYLRLFFHKERTKKRHRQALAASALATARKTEEASFPLQLPEEKV